MAAPSLKKALDDARWLLSKVQAQEAAATGLEQCAADLRVRMQERTSTEGKSSNHALTNGVAEPAEAEASRDEVAADPRPGVGDFYTTEKTRLQQLCKENDDLRQALSEHQHVLEVIMAKYRQQISVLTEARRKDEITASQTQQMHDICRLATQAVAMASTMRKASGLEAELSMSEQESLAEMQYEHQVLREMLETSRPFLTANQLQALIDEAVTQQQQALQTSTAT